MKINAMIKVSRMPKYRWRGVKLKTFQNCLIKFDFIECCMPVGTYHEIEVSQIGSGRDEQKQK